jgi:hypothetical protein
MIIFQYFEGCPNAVQTLRNLRQAMNETNTPDSELKMIEVLNPSDAEKLHFQGSPTILIDGVDIYSSNTPVGFSYSCRVYVFSGYQTGVVPVQFIKEKLTKLLSPKV